MLWNPFSKNNRADSGTQAQGNPKKKILIISIVTGVFILGVFMFVTFRNRPVDYTRSATEAARKQTPNAKVKDVKVAGGFAIATVSDPTAESQIYAGNVTIFRVNEDGSMTQIASGSSFTPLDLLELGIPLNTQSELAGTDLAQVMENLASACGYNGIDAPGYDGLDGSFDPDKWEIDSGMLRNIEQVLTATISNKNAGVKSDEKTICIVATKNNSNATTDTKTYISTFTLELQFISGGGAITTHAFTFSIGPKYYQEFTLDGQKLTFSPQQYNRLAPDTTLRSEYN